MNPILSKAPATSASSSSSSCDEQLVPGSGSSVIADNENLGDNLTDMEEEPNNVKNLGGGSPNSVVSESGSGNSRKRLHSGDFATTGSQTIDLSRDASGSGVGCKSLGENSGPVTNNIAGASENRVAANAPKPLPKRRVEKVATVDVNGVFFMRHSDSCGMYEFGVANRTTDGLRISTVNGKEVINPDQLAEVVYIRKLPEGLGVRLRKAGKGAIVYGAVLLENVTRICNTTRVRVEVSATGGTKTAPLSEVKILKEELSYFINNTTGCFLRVYDMHVNNLLNNWNQLEQVRNGTEDKPLKQSRSKRKLDNDDFIIVDESDSNEPSRKRAKENNTSSAIIVNKHIHQKICNSNNFIVKHESTGKMVGRLETKVTGVLVSHQTLTLYAP